MSYAYDIDISPSDDCRKHVTSILGHVGKFLANRDNGVKQAEREEIERYCESLLKESVSLILFNVTKDAYELELELTYVNVKCKIMRH